MATRIESGQIQLRSVGGAPLQQAQPQAVDQIGFRAQAQTATTMGQILDRMSTALFEEAGKKAQKQAVTDYFENYRVTDQQIENAKNGVPVDFAIGKGFSIYDIALQKARSYELSGRFEVEAKNEHNKIYDKIVNNEISVQDAATKMSSVTDGFSRVLGKEDGEAALKFVSSMGMHASVIMEKGFELESKRKKEQDLVTLRQALSNDLKLIQPSLDNPVEFDQNGNARSVNVKFSAIRLKLGQLGTLLGGREEGAKLEKQWDDAVVEGKISSISNELMKEEYLADSRNTFNNLLLGNLRPDEKGMPNKKDVILQELKNTDAVAYQKVLNNFSTMIDQRTKGIDNALKEDKRAGDVILKAIYESTDANTQQQLFKALKGLAVSPETIVTARNFITSDDATGVQRDDLNQFAAISQRIALGLASSDEVINAKGLTRATKKTFLTQLTNPSDDLGFGVQQIGLSVGIRSDKLPPEMESPKARQAAEETRNRLVLDLYTYARTPNEKGFLPSPPEVRQRGIDLAASAKKVMAPYFGIEATNEAKVATGQLRELVGVDLNNDAAVEAAFTKAVARKADSVSIRAARAAVNAYKENMRKQKEGEQ
jgi:hypothetical protein